MVQYFKENIGKGGRVIATDCSHLAPAVYDADAFYLVPRITAPDYLDRILEICVEEKIDGVFSLIDPELSLLAKEKDVTMVEITLSVPNEDTAAAICNNWQKNNQDIYQYLVSKLF